MPSRVGGGQSGTDDEDFFSMLTSLNLTLKTIKNHERLLNWSMTPPTPTHTPRQLLLPQIKFLHTSIIFSSLKNPPKLVEVKRSQHSLINIGWRTTHGLKVH